MELEHVNGGTYGIIRQIINNNFNKIQEESDLSKGVLDTHVISPFTFSASSTKTIKIPIDKEYTKGYFLYSTESNINSGLFFINNYENGMMGLSTKIGTGQISISSSSAAISDYITATSIYIDGKNIILNLKNTSGRDVSISQISIKYYLYN